MDELLRRWIRGADYLTFRVPCDGDGNITFLGLAYATPAWMAASRDGDEPATHVMVLADPADMARVLVRHPGTGALLTARCVQASYTRGLAMVEHVERLTRAQPGLEAELTMLALGNFRDGCDLQAA